MKKSALTLAGTLLVAGSVVLLAQDPVKVDPAHYKTILDNAAVRVLKVDYPAGAKSPMHAHPDAIVIALSASKVQFTNADKTTTDSNMANESGMYTPAGSHSAVSGGTGSNALVVEFKGAGGKATLPTSRPGMTMKVLAEGPRGMAYKSTADAKFAEPAGTKHDYDQVVIALNAATGMMLSIDGKPAKTTWARGDVQFIPRGTPHESKNTSGKPVDFVIVAIK
jgi:quercetin dioxygenase-like cupin family protein